MSERRDAGFTLVEALVSLFVFSLVAGGCVVMLGQAVESQRRIGVSEASLRQLQTARALLESDLMQIVQRPVRTADNARTPPFVGGDASLPLAFVRASAEPDPTLGAVSSLVYVRYFVRDRQLIRASRSELDATEATPESERVLLDAQNVRFAFYDGANWVEQWSPGGRLPRAVALTAELPRYGAVRVETIVGATR
ncbi:MAG: type II secretion system minor pseudopilin GspJ [Hyphomonadaceae bacterium]|nr:type II secretion system minor pseudopilin GspJ [Hyphomonadaceae bacterium]